MSTEVYFNLHKQCLSLRKKGRVYLHTNTVDMDDVVFVVQPAGRDKVRAEGKKNVHAFVRGHLTAFSDSGRVVPTGGGWRAAYYNPYKVDSWVDRDTHQALTRAKRVIVSGRNVYYQPEVAA